MRRPMSGARAPTQGSAVNTTEPWGAFSMALIQELLGEHFNLSIDHFSPWFEIRRPSL